MRPGPRDRIFWRFLALLLVAAAWWLLGSGASRTAAPAAPEALREPAPPPPRSVQRLPPPGPAPTPSPAPGAPRALEQFAAVQRITTEMEVTALLQRNADEAARTVEAYCERARAVKGRPGLSELLAASGASADAAPFLAPLVDWFLGPGQKREGPLHLPDALRARIAAARRTWPSALSPADARGLDFGWMRQVLAYDHWSLAAAGPIAELREQADPAYVVPDFGLLLSWTKLRYVVAAAGGDLEAAREEVRHLAGLLHSTGIAMADNAAIAMLGLGNRFPGAAAVDVAALEELRDLDQAGQRYFWPGVSAEVTRRAFACAPSPCAGVTEGAFLRRSLGAFSPEYTAAELWDLTAMAGACDGPLLENLMGSEPSTGARSGAEALTLLQQAPGP